MSSRTPLESAPWCVMRHGRRGAAAHGHTGSAPAPAPRCDVTGPVILTGMSRGRGMSGSNATPHVSVRSRFYIKRTATWASYATHSWRGTRGHQPYLEAQG